MEFYISLEKIYNLQRAKVWGQYCEVSENPTFHIKVLNYLNFLVYSFQSKWLKFWHDGRIKRFLSNIPFYCTNVFNK